MCRKLVLFVFALFNCAFVFASASRYSSLLASARECERNGEYAYALGYYYDAIAEAALQEQMLSKDKTSKDADNLFKNAGVAASDAIEGYAELSASIRNGNPGKKQLKGKAALEGWRKLCMDAERYWSEYCPYSIDFSLLKGSSSYEIQNGIYYVSWNYFVSGKYNAIMRGIIIPGLKKAKRMNHDSLGAKLGVGHTWKDFDLWPIHSINSTGKAGGYLVQSDFYENGTPLLYGYREGIIDGKYFEGDLDFDFGRFRGPWSSYNKDNFPCLSPAWNAEVRKSVMHQKEGYFDTFNFIPYACKIAVKDSSGKTILQSDKFLLSKRFDRNTSKGFVESLHGGKGSSLNIKNASTSGSYFPNLQYLHSGECHFRALNSKISSLIDSNQAYIEVTNLYLEYGNLSRIPIECFEYSSLWTDYLFETELDLNKTYVGSEGINTELAFNNVMEGKLDSVSTDEIFFMRHLENPSFVTVKVFGERLRKSNIGAIVSSSWESIFPSEVTRDGRCATFNIPLEKFSSGSDSLKWFVNGLDTGYKTTFTVCDIVPEKVSYSFDVLQQGRISGLNVKCKQSVKAYRPYLNQLKMKIGEEECINLSIWNDNEFLSDIKVPQEKGSYPIVITAGSDKISCGTVTVENCLGSMEKIREKKNLALDEGKENTLRLCKTSIPSNEFDSLEIQAFVGSRKAQCFMDENSYICIKYDTPSKSGDYDVTLVRGGITFDTKAVIKVAE